jgi:hypothetical protein
MLGHDLNLEHFAERGASACQVHLPSRGYGLGAKLNAVIVEQFMTHCDVWAVHRGLRTEPWFPMRLNHESQGRRVKVKQ